MKKNPNAGTKCSTPFCQYNCQPLNFVVYTPESPTVRPWKFDCWKTTFLLGWPTIRGEMLNFQAVYPMVCVVSLLMTTMKKPRGCLGCIGGGHATLCYRVYYIQRNPVTKKSVKWKVRPGFFSWLNCCCLQDPRFKPCGFRDPLGHCPSACFPVMKPDLPQMLHHVWYICLHFT